MKKKVQTGTMEVKGSWKDIVVTCEDVEDKLEGHCEEKQQHLDEWKEWRPRYDDSKEDLRERTAEYASLDEDKLNLPTELATSIKEIEEQIYKNLALKFNPLYFNNQLLSFVLQGKNVYKAQLKLHNNKLRKKVY